VPPVYNVDFLTQNAQRRYPLAVDAAPSDSSGTFRLPDDFLVELQLPVHAGMDVDPSRFFLYQLAAYATGYVLTVGYQPADGSSPVPVAMAMVPAGGFTRNAVFALGGLAPFDDTGGTVTIGSLESIALQPAGFWTFALEAARLDPDALRPILRGVSRLSVVSGTQESVPLYGDITLYEGSNCRLDVVGGDNPQITIHFIDGAGTTDPCACADNLTAAPISSILGIAPDSSGNFTLLGTDCLALVPIANGLRLVDTCAQPCCGCAELAELTADFERLAQQRDQVQAFLTSLQNSVDTTTLSILGSKLNDSSCTACT
jgi:hypothetical protein